MIERKMVDPTPVAKTKTFRSGGGEAVILPDGIAFGADVELIAVRSGNTVALCPVALSLSEMIVQLNALPKPPNVEKRDDSEIPEREPSPE